MQFLLMWYRDNDCRSAANAAVLFSLRDRPFYFASP